MNFRRSSRPVFLIGCAGVLALLAPLALARQADDPRPAEPPPPPGARAPGGQEDNPQRLKEALTRALERAKRTERTLQEGLDMLEKGEPPAKVREITREAVRGEILDAGREMRERRGGGPPGLMPRRPIAGEGPEGPPGPGGPPDGPPPRIDIDAALQVLKETNPDLFERLSRLRGEKPEEFRRIIERNMPRLAQLARDRREDPEGWPDRARLFIVEREANVQARRTAALPPDQQEAARARLRELVGHVFDARVRVAKADMKRLQLRIEMLQREIADKAAQREAVISERVRQMIERATDSLDQPLAPDQPGPPGDDEPGGMPPPARPVDAPPKGNRPPR